MDINSSSVPDRQMLTTLRHFQLWDIARIEPSLLSNLTLLTSLQLVTSYKFNNTHMAALLGVLPKLQQLQHLDILCSLRHGSAATMQLEHCSALTASTNLVSLCLEGVHLPAGCSSQLFGHMMPRLKAIHMDLERPTQNNPASLEHSLVQEDVAAVAANCPHLEKLVLHGVVQRGVNLSDLQRLSCLTALDIRGDFVDDSCAQGLAQLSSLKQLTIYPREVERLPGGGNGSSAEGSDSSAGSHNKFMVAGLRLLMQLSSLQKLTIVPLCMVFKGNGYIYSNSGAFEAPVSRIYSYAARNSQSDVKYLLLSAA
jgi:hypothetical protein